MRSDAKKARSCSGVASSVLYYGSSWLITPRTWHGVRGSDGACTVTSEDRGSAHVLAKLTTSSVGAAAGNIARAALLCPRNIPTN
eukprot:1187283-Prorocentrum_minimum.AAC.2